ncbi:hypothetical protein PI125_g20765 [Phytophthora idaei]|nr:hypothetical protein PI125_g20765 [Phytophthora idaei]
MPDSTIRRPSVLDRMKMVLPALRSPSTLKHSDGGGCNVLVLVLTNTSTVPSQSWRQ